MKNLFGIAAIVASILLGYAVLILCVGIGTAFENKSEAELIKAKTELISVSITDKDNK